LAGEGRCEDEARRVRAHGIDQCASARNIPADAAESLGEGAFYHVDSIADAVELRHAGAMNSASPTKRIAMLWFRLRTSIVDCRY